MPPAFGTLLTSTSGTSASVFLIAPLYDLRTPAYQQLAGTMSIPPEKGNRKVHVVRCHGLKRREDEHSTHKEVYMPAQTVAITLRLPVWHVAGVKRLSITLHMIDITYDQSRAMAATLKTLMMAM